MTARVLLPGCFITATSTARRTTSGSNSHDALCVSSTLSMTVATWCRRTGAPPWTDTIEERNASAFIS